MDSVRLLKALPSGEEGSRESEIKKMTPNFRVAIQKTLKFGDLYILAWWFFNFFIFFRVPCQSQFLRQTIHETPTACRTPESLETCRISLRHHTNWLTFCYTFGGRLPRQLQNLRPSPLFCTKRRSSSSNLVHFLTLLLHPSSCRVPTIFHIFLPRSRSCRWAGQKRNADSAEVG
jgi:hypothetical protein